LLLLKNGNQDVNIHSRRFSALLPTIPMQIRRVAESVSKN